MKKRGFLYDAGWKNYKGQWNKQVVIGDLAPALVIFIFIAVVYMIT